MSKKSTALVVTDHSVPKGSALAKSELDLAEAMVDQFEAFYRQGVILERIKDKKEFIDAGYSSFDKYTNDRMPQGIRKTQAWCLIAAKNVRPLLPDLASANSGGGWSEYSIRPLTHKDFKQSDQRRLGKKIATRVKNGERLTATLVKQICDDDRGVERRTKIKKEKVFKEADLANNLKLAVEMVIGLHIGFQNYYEDAWQEVEVASPGLIRSLIAELDNFTSYLKE